MVVKNVWFLLILVGLYCINGPVVNADYLNPPDWNDSNDFTHQSWDFLTDESGSLPAAPDGEPNWINNFGTPALVDINYSTIFMYWQWDYAEIQTDRRGFYGGMGDTTLTFNIPNVERGDFWQKQIWLQIVYWARKDGGQTYDLAIARDANFIDTNDIILAWLDPNDPNEDEGVIGKFYRLTAAYRFENQPAEEYLEFTAYQYPLDPPDHPMGGATMIDQVSIDTRCINIDLAEDGVIDFKDYAEFAAEYYQSTAAVDLHPDNFIDEKDLSVLLEFWLQ